jgi:hypothetical protein
MTNRDKLLARAGLVYIMDLRPEQAGQMMSDQPERR